VLNIYNHTKPIHIPCYTIGRGQIQQKWRLFGYMVLRTAVIAVVIFSIISLDPEYWTKIVLIDFSEVDGLVPSLYIHMMGILASSAQPSSIPTPVDARETSAITIVDEMISFFESRNFSVSWGNTKLCSLLSGDARSGSYRCFLNSKLLECAIYIFISFSNDASYSKGTPLSTRPHIPPRR
jgi:hypothetical protein